MKNIWAKLLFCYFTLRNHFNFLTRFPTWFFCTSQTNRIQARMDELNLTQEELAIRAEISQAMVYKLLSRKAKSTTKVVQLANALECDIEWLIKGNSATGIKEGKANYQLQKKLSVQELKAQLKTLPKDTQKDIALSIMKDLMGD